MEAKKQEMVEALGIVKPALSAKGIVEQSDCFVFDKGLVRAYNDEIAISCPYETGLSIAVKAAEFYELVSKIPSDKFEMGMGRSKNSLSVSADGMKASIVVAQDVKCPNAEVKAKRWAALPDRFSDAIRFCSFSADRSMVSMELACLMVRGQHVVSSDYFRATKYEMDSKVSSEFMIPADAALQLSNYSPTGYSSEQSWVHFRNPCGVVFSSRAVDGTYPEGVWDLFGKVEEGDRVELPVGLVESIGRARIFSQGAGKGGGLVYLSTDPGSGKLYCRGEGTLGHIEEEFDIGYRKKKLDMKVDSEHMVEILAYVKEMVISGDRLYFRGPNFEHIIALN